MELRDVPTSRWGSDSGSQSGPTWIQGTGGARGATTRAAGNTAMKEHGARREHPTLAAAQLVPGKSGRRSVSCPACHCGGRRRHAPRPRAGAERRRIGFVVARPAAACMIAPSRGASPRGEGEPVTRDPGTAQPANVLIHARPPARRGSAALGARKPAHVRAGVDVGRLGPEREDREDPAQTRGNGTDVVDGEGPRAGLAGDSA
jgi:hypothetical protein